jgi:hypothetical protein
MKTPSLVDTVVNIVPVNPFSAMAYAMIFGIDAILAGYGTYGYQRDRRPGGHLHRGQEREGDGYEFVAGRKKR